MGSSSWHRVRVHHVAFPKEADTLTLGMGERESDGQPLRFLVPPEAVLEVLAALHAGRKPLIKVHSIDVLEWNIWWEEEP